MADFNSVFLIGRLTRDAELRYTNTGQPISKFSLALNKRRKQAENWIEESHFFDVVLWGRLAESLDQYLVKGKQVAVGGELHQNRWQQDGQSRSRVEIVASSVQLLGGGRDSSNYQEEQQYQVNNQSEFGMQSEAGLLDDFQDDIPF